MILDSIHPLDFLSHLALFSREYRELWVVVRWVKAG
jgi:hypothetical protein